MKQTKAAQVLKTQEWGGVLLTGPLEFRFYVRGGVLSPIQSNIYGLQYVSGSVSYSLGEFIYVNFELEGLGPFKPPNFS